MAGQVRVLRRRIRTTASTKKITKAMELVATSRIAKAQERVAASQPYARAITGVLTALASTANIDHPLLAPRPTITPGRRPADHERPWSVRRLQRQRHQDRRAAHLAPARRRQAGRAVRDRPQGRRLLPVPQPARSSGAGPASRSSRASRTRARSATALIEAFVAGADDSRRVTPAPTACSASTSCTSCRPRSGR